MNVYESPPPPIYNNSIANRTPLTLTSHVQLASLYLRCYTLLFDDSFLPVDNNFDLQFEDSFIQTDVIYVQCINIDEIKCNNCTMNYFTYQNYLPLLRAFKMQYDYAGIVTCNLLWLVVFCFNRFLLTFVCLC